MTTDPTKGGENPPEVSLSKVAQQRRAKQDAFLEAYGTFGNIKDAAESAGIGRRTHYTWLERDTGDYKARFEEAKSNASDSLLREARRRAIVGTKEPVFYKGEKIADIRKYSDVLLIFLLKGLMPETFRERYDVRGQAPAPTGEKVIDFSKLTRDEKESLERLLAKSGADAEDASD